MYTKDQIIEYLNSLLDYSIQKNPEEANGFRSYMQPLFSAVNSYFDGNRNSFSKPLEDLQLSLYSEQWERSVKWEFHFERKFGTNPPESYYDLRKLFFSHDYMNTTKEEFHNSWYYETSSDDSGSYYVLAGNTWISGWTSELNAAKEVELDTIKDLTNWSDRSVSDGTMILLWENQGRLLKSLTTEEIANIIFIDKGLKEAIEVLNLPCYKPSYIFK